MKFSHSLILRNDSLQVGNDTTQRVHGKPATTSIFRLIPNF
ncbi:MAG: hypothetical protein NT007_18245 [Candidatus Kapabacteria bacterium]|nr:hypothetical protein [Candidatus Kapabacteria bacterium]